MNKPSVPVNSLAEDSVARVNAELDAKEKALREFLTDPQTFFANYQHIRQTLKELTSIERSLLILGSDASQISLSDQVSRARCTQLLRRIESIEGLVDTFIDKHAKR